MCRTRTRASWLRQSTTLRLEREKKRRGAHGVIEDLTLDNKVVTVSASERVLGVIVSSNLGQWSEQVDNVIKQVAKVVNGLKRGAQYLGFKHRLATARGCHLANLYYCNEVYGGMVLPGSAE